MAAQQFSPTANCGEWVWSRGPRTLGLSMQTKFAYSKEIATTFCSMLEKQLGCPDLALGDLRLALHEAVANAVIHGNLDISSRWHDATSYGAFCAMIDERLRDPLHGERWVRIAAKWLSCRVGLFVKDEGRGFVPKSHANSNDEGHGRGIILMQGLARKVRWNQNLRTLAMIFDRPAASRSL